MQNGGTMCKETPYTGCRNPQFVTVRRGGTREDPQHGLLAAWAADCSEYVIYYFCLQYLDDDRPCGAVEQGHSWSRGEISMTQARELQPVEQYITWQTAIESIGSVTAIDQMPFDLMFVGNSTTGSGCLIQHGNWKNRTTYPPPTDFLNYISASPINTYFPLFELPKDLAGKISDLQIDSQNSAFGKLVETLQEQINNSDAD